MQNKKLKNILDKTERGINLTALITRVLLRWPVLLIAALVFGCFGVGRQYMAAGKATGTETDSAVKTTDYAYLSDRIDEELAVKRNYMQNSVLMNLDNKAVPTAVEMIYVRNSEEPEIDFTFETGNNTVKGGFADRDTAAVMEIMKTYLQYGMDLNGLASELQTEEVYLRELINVSGKDGIATVTAVYKDEAGAEKILDAVVADLQANMPSKLESFENIELIYIGKEVTTIADNTKNTQTNDQAVQINNLLSNKNTLANYKSIFALSPEQGVPGIKSYLKTGIKYGIVGFVLALIAVILKLIFSNSVLSADEMNDHYQLNKLVSVPQTTLGGRKLNGLSKKIIRLDPDSRKIVTPGEITNQLEEAINTKCTGRDRIAVISDLSDKEVGAFIGQFGETNGKILALNHLAEKPEERAQLNQCDKAILLIRVEKSKYSRINEILKLAIAGNIDIIGTVTL